ncbi:MAG: transposase, partial [Halanaerobiales bacterium]|nr:transposase [Halanaerobiales bacterium]
MVTISEKRMNFNSNLKLNFDGGNLTSDSGLLLYKEFDNEIGFSQVIKESLSFDDNIDHRIHKNEDVILQRIYQNAAGYHADSDANDLRYDNIFQTVLNKDILASQSTISRVNTKSN